MTVHTVTRKTQSWYGEQIGILILDAAYPCVPGNVGNATTYDYPVRFQEVPWVPEVDRLQVEPLMEGFWRVEVNYGFKDEPDVPRALRLSQQKGLLIDQSAISYFLSREIVIPTRGAGMAHWREALFATMACNASSVGDFLRLPDNGVVELGTRVQI